MGQVLKTYGKRYIKYLIFAFILQLFSAIGSLSLPSINADIIDKGVVVGDLDFVIKDSAIMLTISAIQVFCSIGAVYFGSKFAFLITKDLRNDFYEKIWTLNLSQYDKFGPSTLITRCTNDMTQVQNVIFFLITLASTAPFMFICGLFLALRQDVPLSMIILIMIPVIGLVLGFIGVFIMKYFQLFQKKLDQINQILEEQIIGVRVVRAFVKEDQEKEKFAVVNNEIYDLNIVIGRTMTILFPIFMLIVNMAILAIMYFGGMRVDNGQMEIGSITAFINYAMYILMSILFVAMIFIMVPRANVSAKRINDVLNMKDKEVIEKTSKKDVAPKKVTVKFDDVTFRYSKKSNNVLENISFELKPGTTTAVIGSTGSGKSSIVNVLTGLYKTNDGQILIGDSSKKSDMKPISEFSKQHISQLIACVPQKVVLFEGTIESNLKFANKNATKKQMDQALEVATAKHFLEERAEKDEIDLYDVAVAQGGNNFSGGQKQRLSIARAILKDTPVIVFDDSLSALDYKTDKTVRTNLTKVAKDKAVLIIAQRVSTVMNADQILVIDDGKIVGIGKHKELLKSNNVYSEIVSSQLKAEEVGITNA
ncbi:MAG: ABC transporter ATP-binding protein/permease [Bifidobacteriaceae bacterium]|jgi:ATP-binding cassette subfamily B protein|nr:ABC transporter ATP-binding protein/permease [Bifidobacteriaceae bacterium]